MNAVRVKAIYSFVPQDETQIGFEEGDVLEVHYKDPSGWWEGTSMSTGDSGFIPNNYVEEMESLFSPPTGSKTPRNASNVDIVPKMNKSKPKPKRLSTRYGMWANNMNMFNGFGLMLTGIASVVTYTEARDNGVLLSDFSLVIFIAAIPCGLAVSIAEYREKSRELSDFPSKALFYLLFAIPWLLTVYTLYHGVLFAIAGVIHYHATKAREQYPMDKPSASAPVSLNPISYYFAKKREGRLGKEVFMWTWIGLNIFVTLNTLFYWYDELEDRRINPLNPDAMFPFTSYLPWARAGGTGLNLSASFILLPVSRTFIRKLYDISTQNHTCSSRILRAILSVIPLDKALHFHEKTGWLILFYGFLHTFAHIVNAGLEWGQVIEFYGWSPLVSGFLIWMCMFFMYSAVLPSVKHHHFEIFWYSHHLFIPFFILLLVHGRGSVGPSYWKWFVVPGTIYVFERIYREYSAYQTVPIISITNMNDSVYSIEFSKKALPNGYKEGQYVYLNAPFLSKGQWHPFTISSAPEDETVTVHIKVAGPGSWTEQLLEYLTLMGPTGASWFSLTEIGDDGRQRGKTRGPMGEKILRLYGPHAAPTQHTPEYETSIIIGSGIGVTPVCSTLQSIVYHRWKFNIGQSFPDHAYFCWVCSHREVDQYRWMIRVVKEAQDAMNQLRRIDPDYAGGKTFEIHIW